MIRLAAKGLFARKLRLALTALCVIIGVSFVSGTYVLTDSMNAAFTELFGSTTKSIDVIVRNKRANPASKTSSSQGAVSERDPNLQRVPESLLAQVRAMPGVKDAEGTVVGSAQITKRDGSPVGGQGPPTLGYSWSSHADAANLRLVSGHAPTGPDEIVVDRDTAKAAHLKLGQKTLVLFDGGRTTGTFRLVGTVRFGEHNELQGATLAFLELRTAQKYFNAGPRFDAIEVQAKRGLTDAQLQRSIQQRLPKYAEAITAQQSVDEAVKGVGQFIDFIQYVTLGFASIALFVAAFTIFNTFSITLAQRIRELGLLRALGASRGQVVRMVLAEALMIGLGSAVVGILAGIGIAYGLRAALDAVGVKLPSGNLTMEPRTVIVALVVGVGVTIGSALVPAIRAARIAPMEALRGEHVARVRSRGRRVVDWLLRIATFGLGALLLGLGLFGHGNGISSTLSLLGAGFVLLIIGVNLIGPVLVAPTVLVLGWPLRRMGVAGDLAARNSVRVPRRTMTTAAALMVGLGIATFAMIFLASVKHTFALEIDRAFGADLSLSSASQGQGGFLPPEIAKRAARVPGVASAVGVRGADAQVGSSKHVSLLAATGDQIDKALTLDIEHGSIRGLGARDIALSHTRASSKHLEVGERVRIKTVGKKPEQFTVAAIFADAGFADAVISEKAFANLYPPNLQLDSVVAVDFAAGADAAKVRKAIEHEFRNEKFVKVQDASEVKQQASSQLDQLLGILLVLLALTVIIALFGIVNTLALSVFERTREIGLLRAVGMTRRQVRRMIRGEAVIVALLGAILGMILGIAVGWAGVRALHSQGLRFALPVGTLAIMLVVAFVAGVVSGYFPARRASRMNILDAISHE